MTEINERRLEHLRRLTELVFHSQRLEAAGVLCPPNHHIEVVRHGWLVDRRSGDRADAPPHQSPTFGPGENLVPSGIFADPFAGGPARWRQSGDEHERSQSLGGPLAHIGAQAGIVQRDESAVVFLKTPGNVGARALARDGSHEVELSMAASPGGTGGHARISSIGTILSLEAISSNQNVHRWRTGLKLEDPTAGGIRLSSLFVLEGHAGQPSSDTHILDSMLATDTVATTLALYWETYADESLPVRVTVKAQGDSHDSLWRRIRRLFGAGEPAGVEISWNDRIAAGTERHYLDVALSPKAEGGYRFTVQVSTLTDEQTQVERRLWIR